MRLKAEAAGRGGNVDVRAEATTLRPAGRQGTLRTVARSPEAGEDDAKEEDGEEVDARRMGRRSLRGRGRSGRKSAAFRGSTTVDQRRAGARV
jgi:hypothetical protein